MKNILIGNGMIIQYGGSDYINYKIIERTMENARCGKYEPDMKKTISPKEAYEFFKLFRKEIYKTIDGEYDQYAVLSSEKEALKDFKFRYPDNRISINNIGFEDYFLVLNLIMNKFGENNETRSGALTAIKRLFRDSIYNGGRINEVYKKFPSKFISFLKDYDFIFTTNYDSNLEKATNNKVYHLHGQFDVLEDVYDKNSFRNKMPDMPAENFDIPTEYLHVYSNTLMDFSKEFVFNMGTSANVAMEKFATAYENDAKVRKDVDTWKYEKNYIVKNLHEAIKYKIEHPTEKLKEYPILEFSSVSGELHILGLSPFNDGHIFKLILENSNITDITYYYYGDNEKVMISELLNSKRITFISSKDLWMEFQA